MSVKYISISNTDTTFQQPRQKTWLIIKLGEMGWSLYATSTSFLEAQNVVKSLLSSGGQYVGINKVMLCELVPIDFTMTPQV